MPRFLFSHAWGIFLFLATDLAWAHVPYFEHVDYTSRRPFRVFGITQSRAVYAWLEVEETRTEDVDVYTFVLAQPKRVAIGLLVPVCKGYDDFRPSFAVTGPGLPPPEETLPCSIPEGHGAIVIHDPPSDAPRESFYEMFGGKHYYRGPKFDQVLLTPGRYRIYFWDPRGHGGDYVAVLGHREVWLFTDILRGLIYTPLIRLDWELHADRADEFQIPFLSGDQPCTLTPVPFL